MLKFVLLCLTLSGFQAVPIKTRTSFQLLDGFREDTEPSRRFLVDLNTGLVEEQRQEEMDRRAGVVRPSVGEGHGEMERRHTQMDEVPDDVPAQRNGGGWVRVEEAAAPRLPDGFRQGTEPRMSIPDGFRQGTEPRMSIPDGFRQGTEPRMSIPDGFRQGTEPRASIPDGFRQGTEPRMSIPDGFRQGTEPRMSLPVGFRQGTEPEISHLSGIKQGAEPRMSIPDGFRQGTEPRMSIPDGFRQGTEPRMSIPDGFRQGTEPRMSITDGFRQGTEPRASIPDGFRQGTEPRMSIPDGFRQGTEPRASIPDGFRQGTEPRMSIPDGFRQGTEPRMSIPDGFRQGTEPSTLMQRTQTVTCKGEVISGKCYEFNPTPLTFQDAQASCKTLAPNAELASVTNSDLHFRLVSLVTSGGERSPVLTWLGATVKNQQASWVDGSESSYNDWMPGHPNVHSDKPVCVEMFRMDESWWTAADCGLKRASICSYLVTA